MTHGDPTHPKKNPHPIERFEVTATADAPGPWDSVKGYITYEVANPECVPRGSFTGGQNVPNTGYDIDMKRVDNKTWRGYFYRDALQDSDYFGLGACHWDVTSVGTVFVVRNETFSSSFLLQDFHDGPRIDYFKKSAYGDPTQIRYGAPGYSAQRPEYKQDPGAFFPVTISVKEVDQ